MFLTFVVMYLLFLLIYVGLFSAMVKGFHDNAFCILIVKIIICIVMSRIEGKWCCTSSKVLEGGQNWCTRNSILIINTTYVRVRSFLRIDQN